MAQCNAIGASRPPLRRRTSHSRIVSLSVSGERSRLRAARRSSPAWFGARCVSGSGATLGGSGTTGAVASGHCILIVDDLLATGGTAAATAKLVEENGGKVAGFGFVVELTFLNGRGKLNGYDVLSLMQYDK